MSKISDVVNALFVLKDFCQEYKENCFACPLYDNKSEDCILSVHAPCEFNFKIKVVK